MILMYQSSNGQTFDLKVGHLRTRTANFHDYQWLPKVIEQRYGDKVYQFNKKSVTYTALLSVFGSLDERRQWLNVLHAAFDSDIANLTPGKIVHGMYSIECYITLSSTYYENPFTQNNIQIYCPYPFWRRELPYHLAGSSDQTMYEYLDYEYGYPYDYKALLPGYSQITNEAVGPCEWKLTIHGPASDPILSIDGRPIGVYATIGADEEVVISSQNRTVIKSGPAGTFNLFNVRTKNPEMFDRLPGGSHAILWSGSFNADIVLYAERSEPPWI